jgi:hypothetical protein
MTFSLVIYVLFLKNFFVVYILMFSVEFFTRSYYVFVMGFFPRSVLWSLCMYCERCLSAVCLYMLGAETCSVGNTQ